MSNEQLNITEYKQALELLDIIRKDVENGEVMSVLIVCEKVNGELMGGTTATQNVFALAGYLMTWMIRRLGFAEWEDVKRVVKGE